MAISKSRLVQAQALAEKSPAFKNFMRGMSSDSAISDYTKYNLNFMDFHNLGEDFDSLVKNDPKTISKLITEFLDSCLERGVKNATLRTYLMGVERMFIMNDCIWHT